MITRHAVEAFLDRLTLATLVDVRSPGEFARGHIPGAVNIPLFSDAERAEVGTLYKQESAEAALLRGLEFAGPKLAGILRSARSVCPERPASGREIALYCGRGGMRSASVAWLLSLSAFNIHLLDGGYKSYRGHVLDFLQKKRAFNVLGGATGAGKTEVLGRMSALGAFVIDLEGLAEHRGSAFGSLPGRPQPTNEHFENRLAAALRACPQGGPIWIEDECENLGTVNLPGAIFKFIRNSPLFILEVSRQRRLARVLEEYGGLDRQSMAGNLDRIKKRLGGAAHKQGHTCLESGDLAGLAAILLDYYDRAYARQLAGREVRASLSTDSPADAAKSFLDLCK